MEAPLKKSCLNAVVQAREQERKRISEAIHNGLGQLLYGIKLKINELAPGSDKRVELDKMIDEAIKQTRYLAFELSPSALTERGFERAVSEMVNMLNGERLKIKLEFNGYDKKLDHEFEISLYRIVQELINNSVKHARADKINVRIEKIKKNIFISINDNGVGFDAKAESVKPNGIGLASIKSRIKLLNGALTIDSGPGNGTKISIRVKEKAESRVNPAKKSTMK